MKTNPDEIFDVVDENDNVLYSEKRDIVHQKKLRHRASHLIVFDDKGRILLQKRAASKDLHPLEYTTSCSGHVDSGETYLQAAIRETYEELGIHINASDLTEIGKVSACESTGNENTFLYTMIYNPKKMGEFNAPEDEVDSLEWTTIENFEKAFKKYPKKFTPSFLKMYEFYKSKLK